MTKKFIGIPYLKSIIWSKADELRQLADISECEKEIICVKKQLQLLQDITNEIIKYERSN
ncbi:MAG: hypothetical protein ACFFDN_02745 [Candidatus Hodarchaeota archaeon]